MIIGRREFLAATGGVLVVYTSSGAETITRYVSGRAAQGGDEEGYYFERSFTSAITYDDPFNEVEVDVIFTLGLQSWRVPTFWRGESTWTVRFAPPVSGEYSYRLESNDRTNPDLNGRQERVMLRPYVGSNELVQRGMLRVSGNRRYFEHSDGTPFFWLMTGTSKEDDASLRASRTMGFNVAIITAGLAPWRDEVLTHPDFSNAGGFVWEKDFARINPRFFDEMDKEIVRLIDAGFVPFIVGGGWWWIIDNMGVAKMKQQWRNLIGRYGAYPVIWMLCWELPNAQNLYGRTDITEVELTATEQYGKNWGEVAKYVRAIDPYRHLLSAVEVLAPYHGGFRDAALTDFDLPDPSYTDWSGVAAAVAQITSLYGRKHVTKPVVQGDITPEDFAGGALADYQRISFWLAVLNGAAGYTYGYAGEGEQRKITDAPGARQIILGSRLLQKYPWHKFAPHPEWVTPRGTTLFDVDTTERPVDLDLLLAYIAALKKTGHPLEDEVPTGEWRRRNGTFRLPYAAGIPGVVRLVYIPYTGYVIPNPPTILRLEDDAKYRGYFWNPETAAEIDLGEIARPPQGPVIFKDQQAQRRSRVWTQLSDFDSADGAPKRTLSLLSGFEAQNVIATINFRVDVDIALVFRYRDCDNYVAAHYSALEKSLFIRLRNKGRNREPVSRVYAGEIGSWASLTAEVNDGFAIVSLASEDRRVTSEIVSLGLPLAAWPEEDTAQLAGAAGLMHYDSIAALGDFELRRGKSTMKAAVGRGHMGSEPPGELLIPRNLFLLDAYRPEWFPTNRDWVLVLENRTALGRSGDTRSSRAHSAW